MGKPASRGTRVAEQAEGTDGEAARRKRCSDAIMEEYTKYLKKERSALQKLPRGAEGWWSKSKRMMQRRAAVSSVPVLRGDSGNRILDPKEKATLFVQAMSKKQWTTAAVTNEYSNIESTLFSAQTDLAEVSEMLREKVLPN